MNKKCDCCIETENVVTVHPPDSSELHLCSRHYSVWKRQNMTASVPVDNIIKVGYKCAKHPLPLVESDTPIKDSMTWVEVPKRNKALDITYWMENIVMPRIFADHYKKTKCTNPNFDLAIPMSDENGVIGRDIKKDE